jgi:hypothetical protein
VLWLWTFTRDCTGLNSRLANLLELGPFNYTSCVPVQGRVDILVSIGTWVVNLISIGHNAAVITCRCPPGRLPTNSCSIYCITTNLS